MSIYVLFSLLRSHSCSLSLSSFSLTFMWFYVHFWTVSMWCLFRFLGLTIKFFMSRFASSLETYLPIHKSSPLLSPPHETLKKPQQQWQICVPISSFKVACLLIELLFWWFFSSFVWSFFAVIAAAAAVILYYGLMLFIIKVIVTYETIIGYMYVKS